MYHLLTRRQGVLEIHEEAMDLIDLNTIQITSIKATSIHFTDKFHEYSFNLSKSTLFKRFHTFSENKIYGFPVEILEDPYEFLLTLKNAPVMNVAKQKEDEYILLPLYSARSMKVEAQSGLNQWNAKGRKRDPNEVYIPIPAWIHKVFRGFFNYSTENFKTEAFQVLLPNGKVLSMKVAQSGGKALMSNPNSALGEWLLRDILQIQEGKVVTKEMLDILGIDSVKLTKLENNSYRLDFLKVGSYEAFAKQFKPR